MKKIGLVINLNDYIQGKVYIKVKHIMFRLYLYLYTIEGSEIKAIQWFSMVLHVFLITVFSAKQQYMYFSFRCNRFPFLQPRFNFRMRSLRLRSSPCGIVWPASSPLQSTVWSSLQNESQVRIKDHRSNQDPKNNNRLCK